MKQRVAHSKNLLAAWKVAVQESNYLNSIEAEKERYALMEMPAWPSCDSPPPAEPNVQSRLAVSPFLWRGGVS